MRNGTYDCQSGKKIGNIGVWEEYKQRIPAAFLNDRVGICILKAFIKYILPFSFFRHFSADKCSAAVYPFLSFLLGGNSERSEINRTCLHPMRSFHRPAANAARTRNHFISFLTMYINFFKSKTSFLLFAGNPIILKEKIDLRGEENEHSVLENKLLHSGCLYVPNLNAVFLQTQQLLLLGLHRFHLSRRYRTV